MWPTSSSLTAYENAWITVREDTVTMPDGSDGVYGVVTLRHPAVFIVALTDADEVVLVHLDRHTTGPSIEVPAGGTDGEDALVAAQRELLEETGYTATSWQRIGSMNALNGVCDAPEWVYLARGLSAATPSGVDEEGISAVRAVPWGRVMDMVRHGRITDSETIASLMFAALALGRL